MDFPVCCYQEVMGELLSSPSLLVSGLARAVEGVSDIMQGGSATGMSDELVVSPAILAGVWSGVTEDDRHDNPMGIVYRIRSMLVKKPLGQEEVAGMQTVMLVVPEVMEMACCTMMSSAVADDGGVTLQSVKSNQK